MGMAKKIGKCGKLRKIDFFENIAVFKWILDKKKILKSDAPLEKTSYVI